MGYMVIEMLDETREKFMTIYTHMSSNCQQTVVETMLERLPDEFVEDVLETMERSYFK